MPGAEGNPGKTVTTKETIVVLILQTKEHTKATQPKYCKVKEKTQSQDILAIMLQFCIFSVHVFK